MQQAIAAGCRVVVETTTKVIIEPPVSAGASESVASAPKNAFQMLMASKKQKVTPVDETAPAKGPPIDELECKRNGWLVGVVYRRTLVGVPADHPLHGIQYHGQSFRTGLYSPISIAAERWRKEDTQALRETHHEYGHLWAIRVFGKDAFHNEVVQWHVDEPVAVLEALDAGEVAAVANGGGLMRSRTKRLKQTLNLTRGGRGAYWLTDYLECRSVIAWERAQQDLLAAVLVVGHAAIPSNFVHPATGRATGNLVGSLRSGEYLNGKPDEIERRNWLGSLPGWQWNIPIHRWECVQTALLAAIEIVGSARIPTVFVHPVSGHRTGHTIIELRRGDFMNESESKDRRRAWLEALPGWTWNVSDSMWEEAMCNIIDAISVTGTSCLPSKFVHPVTGHATGELVIDIRRGRLLSGKGDESERRAWLQSLPGWTWNVADTTWEQAKITLMAAIALQGTAHIAKSFVHPTTGHKTGLLIERIRRGAHLKGKEDEVDRRTWLAALPGWTWNAIDERWHNAQQALLDAIEIVGKCPPSGFVHPTTGHKTGVLMVELRRGDFCKGKQDEDERREWLQSLPGFTPKQCVVRSWEDAQHQLKSLVDTIGTCNVTRRFRHPDSDFAVGQMIFRIRTNGYMLHGCPDEQQRRAWLSSLPGWQWVVDCRNGTNGRKRKELKDATDSD